MAPRTSKPGRWQDDWRKRNLMDWLVTPPSEREPRSKKELAELFEVTPKTLENWSSEVGFRAEWERRSREVIGDPDRAQTVLDALYLVASDPTHRSHVQAAKLYLEATKAISPPVVEMTLKRPGELTDAELDAMLAQGAAQLRDERAADER